MRLKKNTHSIEVVFVAVLFSIFAVLSMLLIFIGSDVYKGVLQDTEKNTDMRNSISYLVNKIRTNDRKDAIVIEEIEGVPVLVLKNEKNGTVYKNLLYYHDGAIKEALTEEGMEFELSYGQDVMQVNGFDISYSEEEHILSITVEDCDGNKRNTGIALRSGK